MKTAEELCTEYRDLLDDFADVLAGGFRRRRGQETPPRILFESARPEPSSVSSREERLRLLSALAAEVQVCTRCPLARKRKQAVPGEGVLDPLVMVIGEGPGEEEDLRGLPFVGPAGQYLDKWLEGTGKIDGVALSRRTNAYIANIVKCRPPGNRDPEAEETAACMPYLLRQLEIIRPRIILAAGRIAAQNLLNTDKGIGQLRGRPALWQGVPLIATYHPSAVLRDQNLRRPVWEDMKKLKELINGN
jgi:DNA polymerase